MGFKASAEDTSIFTEMCYMKTAKEGNVNTTKTTAIAISMYIAVTPPVTAMYIGTCIQGAVRKAVSAILSVISTAYIMA